MEITVLQDAIRKTNTGSLHMAIPRPATAGFSALALICTSTLSNHFPKTAQKLYCLSSTRPPKRKLNQFQNILTHPFFRLN